MSSSNLTSDPLRQPPTISSMQTLTRLLETTIGPKGKLKLLENTKELTSSSQRLLKNTSIKNIISKIIVTTAKTQLGTFNDGGLFCALLILKLVCPVASDSGRSLPLVGTLYEYFAVEFLSLLKMESSFEVDFLDLEHLKSVVLTVLSSKPGCLLSRWDRNYLCSLLLRAFLDCVPSDGGSALIPDCFRFLSVDGLPTKESRLLKGVLVQIPETDEKRFKIGFAQKVGQPIKVALFTCSLAGDADWPVGALETTSLDSVIESTLKLLDNVVSQLILDGISFVFCQKVVHPRIKKRLHKSGIMILDRLGSEAAKCIQYISGGTSITSLSCEMSYGTISIINIEHLGTKSFLLLTSSDTPIFSIVLAHYNEEASAELKIVCRQAMDSLFRILQNPRVCFGGGCSEIRSGIFLANKVRSNLDVIKNETGCTTGQILESLSTFLQAIAKTCVSIHQGNVLDFVIESTNGHLWKLHNGHFPTADHRCQCGSHRATLVDPSAWSFLSDIHHHASISSDKSSIKLAPTINNESFEFLNSSIKDVQKEDVVSSNVKSASQLPTNSNLSPKCESPSNYISNKSEQLSTNVCSSSTYVSLTNAEPVCQLSTNLNSLTCDPLSSDMPACQLSTIISSSPVGIPLSNTEPVYQLPKNINYLTYDPMTNDTPASQLSSTISSPTTSYDPSGNTVPDCQLYTFISSSPVCIPLSSSIPACQSFANSDTLKSSASCIGPDVTASSRCSKVTHDATNSILLDELTCKLNSLSLAFETASLLLRTTICINNLPT